MCAVIKIYNGYNNRYIVHYFNWITQKENKIVKNDVNIDETSVCLSSEVGHRGAYGEIATEDTEF